MCLSPFPKRFGNCFLAAGGCFPVRYMESEYALTAARRAPTRRDRIISFFVYLGSTAVREIAR